MQRIHQFLQAGHFGSIPAAGDSQGCGGAFGADHLEPQLRIHPDRGDVVYQPAGRHGEDGTDYAKVCSKHQWASPFGPEPVSACPECVAEADAIPGHLRYAEIHTRLVLGL